jgi:hypothetical protein
MKQDTLKVLYTYAIATFIIASTFYALVIYPYELSDSVKLYLTTSSGGAMAFIFGDQIASRVRHEQQSAFDKGLYSPTPNGAYICPLDNQSFTSQQALDEHVSSSHV